MCATKICLCPKYVKHPCIFCQLLRPSYLRRSTPLRNMLLLKKNSFWGCFRQSFKNLQSHDSAKYLRICGNYELINKKQENHALISYICHNLTKCSSFTWFLCKIVNQSIFITQMNLLLKSLVWVFF